MEYVVGTQPVNFSFGPSKTSERSITEQIAPPENAVTALILLTGFEANYVDDKQYGFGKLKVDVIALSTEAVQGTIALRDDHTNERNWEGQIKATVVFLGSNG